MLPAQPQPLALESPSKQTQKPQGSQGTPTRPRHTREDAALSPANPGARHGAQLSTTQQHFACNSQVLFTGILYPWQLHQGPCGNTLPQTLPQSHREHHPSCVQSSQGQPAPIETGDSSQARPCSVGRAVEGSLFTSCFSSKQLSGCGEGFPSLRMEGKSSCFAPSHPGLHLPARDNQPPSFQRDPRVRWGPG